MILVAGWGCLFLLPYIASDNSDSKGTAAIVAIPGLIILAIDLIVFLVTRVL